MRPYAQSISMVILEPSQLTQGVDTVEVGIGTLPFAATDVAGAVS